jgi:hypothetical protein
LDPAIANTSVTPARPRESPAARESDGDARTRIERASAARTRGALDKDSDERSRGRRRELTGAPYGHPSSLGKRPTLRSREGLAGRARRPWSGLGLTRVTREAKNNFVLTADAYILRLSLGPLRASVHFSGAGRR